MRTKWQLVKECCACHLQVRAGVKPGVVVAWSCSCNGWWLFSIVPEIAGLTPAFWRQTKKSTKKPKKPTHWDDQRPAPATGCLQPPAQRPAAPLHYHEIFLSFFHKNLPFQLSLTPELWKFMASKANARRGLGGWPERDAASSNRG